MKRVILGVLLLLLFCAARAEATNRYVCNAGDATCGGTPAYTTVQLAVDVAVCGDTIFVLPGTYVYGFQLKNTVDCGAQTNWILIRSLGSDANFPSTGNRLIPTTRADGVTNVGGVTLSGNTNPANLATFTSPNASTAAVRVVNGAQDYILRFLRFTGNPQGQGAVIELGSNVEEFVALQPKDILVDRVLFEVDPLVGQKQGLMLNGANLSVENSYFTNFVGLGQDAACAIGSNGTGPISFINNYCEGAGYGFITGGDRPNFRTFVNTTTGSTTTSIKMDAATFRVGHTCAANTFGNAAALVGKHVAIQTDPTVDASGNLTGAREHAYITAVDCATNTLTVDTDLNTAGNQPLAMAPPAGMDVRWGAIYDGITVERNWFYNPPKWASSIVPAPSGVTGAPGTVSGTLAVGTYYYVVSARKSGSYGNNTIESGVSAQVACVLDTIGSCRITWNAVSGATAYRIWGRSNGGQTSYTEVASPTVAFNDTGAALTAGTNPGATGSRWVQKNHYEVKQGTNVNVRYNIFDNKNAGLGGTGSGIPLWIKSTNQLIGGSFGQTRNVLVAYNIIRNSAGFMNVTSREETYPGNNEDPDDLENVVVEHNLVYNVGVGVNYALIFGYAGAENFTFRNNTVLHTTQGAWNFAQTDRPWKGVNTVYDNIFIHNTYGFKSDYFVVGSASIAGHFGADTAFHHNAITTSSYTYPAGTLKPTTAELQAAFVNYGGGSPGDYDLVTGHAWRTAGSTGGRLGADIPQIVTLTSGTIPGTASGAPVITTAAVPNATVGVAYSSALTVTGGTGSKTWTATGTLPTGISIGSATGILSGTPTTVGTYSFTVRATDSASAFSERSFTIVVSASASSVVITTTLLQDGQAGTAYSQLLQASGGNGIYAWTIANGAIPSGLSLNQTTGLLSGTPSSQGSFTFTVQVASGSGTATQQFTVAIGSEPSAPITTAQVIEWNGQQIRSFRTPGAPLAEDGARVGDLWIDPTNRLCVITATSPATTYTCYLQQGEAGGGGGGLPSTYTYRQWIAPNAVVPATLGAAFDLRNDNTVLGFADSATETAYFEGTVPTEYDGGAVIVELRWTSVSTTGNVRWAVAFEMQNALDIDGNDFAANKLVTAAVPATSGLPALTSITFTNVEADTIAAGASFRIRVQRIGADGADDAVGDAQLLRVNLRK